MSHHLHVALLHTHQSLTEPKSHCSLSPLSFGLWIIPSPQTATLDELHQPHEPDPPHPLHHQLLPHHPIAVLSV
jgi:hypothetical protein